MTRVQSLNRELKNYDGELYVQETQAGRLDVCRKSKFGMSPPNYIFSLTEDWSARSKPVPWSTDIVMNRIRAHDLWRDDTFVEQWIKQREKEVESQERARKNTIESFLYDFRRQFGRATNEINTSTLSNKENRKD